MLILSSNEMRLCAWDDVAVPSLLTRQAQLVMVFFPFEIWRYAFCGDRRMFGGRADALKVCCLWCAASGDPSIENDPKVVQLRLTHVVAKLWPEV